MTARYRIVLHPPPFPPHSSPLLRQQGAGGAPPLNKTLNPDRKLSRRHVVLQRRPRQPSLPARAELLRGAPRLRGGGRGVGVPPHRAPRPRPQHRRRGGGAPPLGRARRRRPPRRRGRGHPRGRGRRGEQGRARRLRPDAPRHRRRRRRLHELRSPRRRRPLRPAPREVHGQGSQSSRKDHKEQHSWTEQKQQW
uniref:Uncharacterized protein n=1 Tax=Triticum urartu TaxID=4572 RepID=A0A8R7P2Y2_TRIUA